MERRESIAVNLKNGNNAFEAQSVDRASNASFLQLTSDELLPINTIDNSIQQM